MSEKLDIKDYDYRMLELLLRLKTLIKFKIEGINLKWGICAGLEGYKCVMWCVTVGEGWP